MAKKKTSEPENAETNPNVLGLRAEITEQPITDTLEVNYMPYAMSVIVSRAIPEIDGFKPAHRKLLYTMYKMGLLTGSRTKSANIVGSTMKLNPHGDAAIYDTMVRLSKGYGALLTPFVDSKGNFGKVYSRDMAYAASRYTEAKLADICSELFRDIDRDTVDFADSYDGSMQEPQLLPTSFPNILVSANQGIAVGMASNLCGFNLEEVCRAEIAFLKNPDCDLMELLPAPDFPTGGELLYSKHEMEEIYRTGRGSFRVRSKWSYDKSSNIIEIHEIPYTTTSEAILDKVSELVKEGKLREISDMRDETDLNGLKLAIDLKRGTNPDLLMQKLFKSTPLMDSFSCNFNILIAGMPKVMGIREILDEWTGWRLESIRRRCYYELSRKKERLHLLTGLQRILLDIDKAIHIIRETKKDSEVIPNLMSGFAIDKVQAEYVAEIKLRNINQEYILRQIKDLKNLEKEIADLADTINRKEKLKAIIRKELEQVIRQYPSPRRTTILYDAEATIPEYQEETPDYPVTVFLSRHGYLKKITPQSLRSSGEQKLKDDDALMLTFETSNRNELLLFTDKQQVYKLKLSSVEDGKASLLGCFLPGMLQMEEEESIITALIPGDYSGVLLLAFANGKIARIPLNSYATKNNRRKLTAAFSAKSSLCGILRLPPDEEREIALFSGEKRAVLFDSAKIPEKQLRTTIGVQVMSVKAKYPIERICFAEETLIRNKARYRCRNLPSSGAILKPDDCEKLQSNLGPESN